MIISKCNISSLSYQQDTKTLELGALFYLLKEVIEGNLSLNEQLLQLKVQHSKNKEEKQKQKQPVKKTENLSMCEWKEIRDYGCEPFCILQKKRSVPAKMNIGFPYMNICNH